MVLGVLVAVAVVGAIIGAIALLVVRPQKLRLPMALLIASVAGMWLFEMFRFSVL